MKAKAPGQHDVHGPQRGPPDIVTRTVLHPSDDDAPPVIMACLVRHPHHDDTDPQSL
jgi:hypothetical protein